MTGLHGPQTPPVFFIALPSQNRAGRDSCFWVVHAEDFDVRLRRGKTGGVLRLVATALRWSTPLPSPLGASASWD
jgi:hypothetical protein